MPELPDTERLFAIGLAAMFGSVLVHGIVAAIVGRVTGSFDAGASAGMVLFGLTALTIGAIVGWIVLVQSVEIEARLTGCEVHDPEPGSPPEAMSRRFYASVAGDGPRRLFTALERGECGETEVARTPDGTFVLRVRRSALRAALDPMPAERVQDRKQAPAVVGVFGAFGGFWFLSGLVMAASRRERQSPSPDRAVSEARARCGTTLGTIGHLLLAGSLLVASVADWDATRRTLFAFQGVAGACAFYAAAFFARRKLTVTTALTLLIVGGGFGLAAWSLKYLG
jgi:hypothetical protein